MNYLDCVGTCVRVGHPVQGQLKAVGACEHDITSEHTLQCEAVLLRYGVACQDDQRVGCRFVEDTVDGLDEVSLDALVQGQFQYQWVPVPSDEVAR